MKPFKRLTLMLLDAQENLQNAKARADDLKLELDHVKKERDELRLRIEKLQAELRPPRPDLAEVRGIQAQRVKPHVGSTHGNLPGCPSE